MLFRFMTHAALERKEEGGKNRAAAAAANVTRYHIQERRLWNPERLVGCRE